VSDARGLSRREPRSVGYRSTLVSTSPRRIPGPDAGRRCDQQRKLRMAARWVIRHLGSPQEFANGGSCLVPASPAVPAAAENDNHDDQNDEKCGVVHLSSSRIRTGSLYLSRTDRAPPGRPQFDASVCVRAGPHQAAKELTRSQSAPRVCRAADSPGASWVPNCRS
jgi:hypothetical protein